MMLSINPRALGLALICSLSAIALNAQAAPADRGEKLKARFEAADTNGDGKLSKDEAKAKMPMVYKHFDEIDTGHTGSVTMADIAAFAKAHHDAKKATP